MDKKMNGSEVSKVIKQELKDRIVKINDKLKLVVIQVGNNAASNIYVSKKQQLCGEVGIECDVLKYDDISEKELISIIDELNNNINVTSILVQLPLPKTINEENIIERINYKKDVDGLTSINLGKLYSKQNSIIPCTAYGIMKLLEYYNIPLEGKNVTIIGRTKLVGIPLNKLMMDKDCTVTVCHSKTNDLSFHTKNADILVVAAGQKHLINKDMVKENAIVIDVGINREEKKLYGDVNYEDVLDKVKMITPVPGGVGPMTVVMLINNVIDCYDMQKNELIRCRKTNK